MKMLKRSNYIETCSRKMTVIGSNLYFDLLASEETNRGAVGKTPELVMIVNEHFICEIKYFRVYREYFHRRRVIDLFCGLNSKCFSALLHNSCYCLIKDVIGDCKGDRYPVDNVILYKGPRFFMSIVSFIVKGYKKGCISKDYFGHLIPYKTLSIRSLLVCPMSTGSEEKKGSLFFITAGFISFGHLIALLSFSSKAKAFIIQILLNSSMSCQWHPQGVFVIPVRQWQGSSSEGQG